MVKKIELLAPAGDFNSLHAAVENGADAVYLGGKLFNARQFAGNFDMQKMKEALDYAHIRGVNIYLTMNTLISDREMKEAVEFAQEAYLLGIDGIIVQDVGFAGLINKLMPDLPLHASTQMTVHNLHGVKLLENMGFKRVVLARELTLDEITEIAAGTSMEIEVFIHGALCICYSGQCLMSSIIGGRSGNRGKCAQPCRLPYRLIESGGSADDRNENAASYLLSPKDLCTLPQLTEIAASGVKSLKIEGRMKSPEYVATVVRIYRKYLDLSTISPDFPDMYQLAQIFNRGGFTGGYLAGNHGKDLMCYEKPKNWGTFLGEVLSYDRPGGIVKVRLSGSLAIGDGIEVWNDENENPGTIVTLIRANGRNVKEASRSDVVEIGDIKGNIFKDCKVFKTSDKKLLDTARESFEGKSRKRVKIKGEVFLKNELPLILKVYDEEDNVVEAEGAILPEKARTRPLTPERLADQLKKTGATAFEFCDLKIQMEDELALPVSEINDIRRKALDKLEEKRKQKYAGARCRADLEMASGKMNDLLNFKGINDQEARGRFCCFQKGSDRTVPLLPRISLYFYEWNSDIEYAGLGADRLYLPFKALLNPGTADKLSVIRNNGIEVFIWTPVIIQGNYLKLLKVKFNDLKALNIDGILAGNPGVREVLGNRSGVRLMGDHSFNIFNTHSALMYNSMGFDGITLSSELNLGQMCDISGKTNIAVESIVYGRLPLMTSEYCPVGSVKGGFSSGIKCGGNCSKGEFRLKDRLGIEFPVICDKIDCRSMILNSNVLFVPDALKKLADTGVKSFRLLIHNESTGRIKELVSLHRELACTANTGKYAALVDHIKSEGFTKGHFYKGV